MIGNTGGVGWCFGDKKTTCVDILDLFYTVYDTNKSNIEIYILMCVCIYVYKRNFDFFILGYMKLSGQGVNFGSTC